ncbi:MAG: hypothetical protein ACREDF_08500, partial [Thermoplasmata archaeon]
MWRGHKAGHRKAARKGWRRRRRGSRRSNPVVHRTRKARSRRRRNPEIMGVSLAPPATVAPLSIPIPGILGDIANGILNAAFSGTLVFGGYLASGAVVDFIWSKQDADSPGTGDFKSKYLRPLLFGAIAGLTGSAFAMLAPKGKKMTWGLLASAGPGIRAISGLLMAFIPATSTGALQEVRRAASGLSDYLQVDGETSSAGVEDYLQVDDIYEAGMGNGTGDLYEAGMGEEEEEEVVGI